jgi:hypothetical protein
MLNEYFVEWVSRFYDLRFVTFVKNGFPGTCWNGWISCVLLGIVFQVITVLGYYVQWLSMYLLAFYKWKTIPHSNPRANKYIITGKPFHIVIRAQISTL